MPVIGGRYDRVVTVGFLLFKALTTRAFKFQPSFTPEFYRQKASLWSLVTVAVQFDDSYLQMTMHNSCSSHLQLRLLRDIVSYNRLLIRPARLILQHPPQDLPARALRNIRHELHFRDPLVPDLPLLHILD